MVNGGRPLQPKFSIQIDPPLEKRRVPTYFRSVWYEKDQRVYMVF